MGVKIRDKPWDRQTDRHTLVFIELLLQLKNRIKLNKCLCNKCKMLLICCYKCFLFYLNSKTMAMFIYIKIYHPKIVYLVLFEAALTGHPHFVFFLSRISGSWRIVKKTNIGVHPIKKIGNIISLC